MNVNRYPRHRQQIWECPKCGYHMYPASPVLGVRHPCKNGKMQSLYLLAGQK
jgi:ribosomal protein L37AE/L43A